MKTDKFEKIIRRKLESISPEFREDDWTKMQNYMHAQTPPGFWQQYGSWLGYAAAAAVTSVVAFLYVNQLSQNNHLLSDVKQLQNQIDIIKSTPNVVQKADTVYIVQQQKAREDLDITARLAEQKPVGQQHRNAESSKTNNKAVNPEISNPAANPEQPILAKNRPDPVAGEQSGRTAGLDETGRQAGDERVVSVPAQSSPERLSNDSFFRPGNSLVINGSSNPVASGNARTSDTGLNTTKADNLPNTGVGFSKTLDGRFDQLEIQKTLDVSNQQTLSRRMNYSLAHRIAPNQVKSVLLANNASQSKVPESEKNIESVKKAKTAIPKLNLKVPYRFGFAQQWEGKNRIKAVLTEILFAKHLSLSTGVSWLKLKPVDFRSDKMYNEITRSDFKRDHLLPMGLKIANINVKSSVVQIPLNIAFRNEIKNNFAYFVSAGTNFTLQSKKEITYDCYFTVRDPWSGHSVTTALRRDGITKKMDLNLLNSYTLSAGIEKSWHPVVVQAEGYLYGYRTPMDMGNTKTGPGFKIKVLYQIGRKM